MSSVFAGLRVVDFTTTIAGPHCSRMLADLGAEVIKVEAPEGDMMRSRPPLRDGASTSFGQLNAGKKSVVLDLKVPAAAEAARRLAATADVLVENYRPGVMARLALDYDTLAPLNPRLIYAAISGYGQTGPSSRLAAYAPVIHAASGYDLAHLRYQQGRTRPDYCGVYIADVLSGTYAFGAIAAALHHRNATGRGQLVDVSMFESMLTLTLPEIQLAQFTVPPVGKPLFGPLETADGYIMVAIASERTFQGVARASGHAEWLTDPRFAQYAERRAHWGEVIDGLEAWSRPLSAQACLAALDRHGVPASAYRTVKDAMADPQVAHRGALAEIHDDGGSFFAVNPPFRMSEARVHAGPRAPALGEHTGAILGEIGYGPADIAAMATATAAAEPRAREEII